MRTYDFAPLWRSTIGFDRLFDLLDATQRAAGEDHYPLYNIERLGQDRYQISLALAGFNKLAFVAGFHAVNAVVLVGYTAWTIRRNWAFGRNAVATSERAAGRVMAGEQPA